MKKLFLMLILLLFPVLLFSKVISSANYAAIDSQAKKLNAQSISGLADYINQNYKQEDEKARFIYSWITAHIQYDVQSFFSGRHADNSAEGVFKTGKSVCEGYSELFLAVAEKCGLQCAKISGYAKGYGYQPGQHFSGYGNHAWNAVKINDEWYLIDTTWGAGYVDDSKQFIFRYTDYFFCTPPDEFILSHFPIEPEWQLLDEPVSLTGFEVMANPLPEYFINNLNLLNHKTGVINIESKTMIAIRADENISLLVRLTKEGKDFSDQLFYQYVEDQYQINLHFHTQGKYQLNIYAKQKTEDSGGDYPAVLQFTLNVKSADSGFSGFPEVSSMFIDYQCALLHPLEKQLPVKSKTDFQLIVPEADSVAVIYQGEWIFLYKRKGIYYYNNFFCSKEGEIKILARFPKKDNQYWELLTYDCY